jgi:hypothetical protein
MNVDTYDGYRLLLRASSEGAARAETIRAAIRTTTYNFIILTCAMR